MPFIELEGLKVELNEEGFLADPEQWDERVALALARAEEGLEELT